MLLFGIDIGSVLVTAGFVVFWGGLFISFIFFYNINPYVPRKYYKVKITNKDGMFIRNTKAWKIKDKKVDYLRLGCPGNFGFAGVNMDAAMLKTVNAQGECEFTELVPGNNDPTNYIPKVIPLTQLESFITQEKENTEWAVVNAINSGIKKNQAGDYYVDEARVKEIIETANLKTKDTLTKNSRIQDLNQSATVRARIDVVRNQDERKKGGEDFIGKYGPILALIVAGLFAYLILDGAVKSYQTTMEQQNAVMENGYSQVIQQCGGVYHSITQPTNTTTKSGSVSIPGLPV